MPSLRSILSRSTAQVACVSLTLTLWLVASASATPSIRFPDRSEAVPDLVPATVDGRLPVLLETNAGSALADRIAELGGEVTHVFENAGLVSALVSPEALESLQKDGRVETVTRQRLVRLAVVEPRVPGMDRRRALESTGHFVLPRTSGTPRVRALTMDDLRARKSGDDELVSFIGYDEITRASEVWEATNYGEDAVVAIIDTGIYEDHPLLEGSVIGGFNLVPAEEEMAIDADGDGTPEGLHFDWNRVENNGHGTFVAGVVAGHAMLGLPEDDGLIQSILAHSPESVALDGKGNAELYLAGTAPAASLFGVKVFPYDGGSAPDARVAEAIDRLITMKRRHMLDLDVINMSLSGPVLNDGRNPLDRITDAATRAGITVVAAASNDGPALTSVGSPGSAFTALTVGGTYDPIHMRVAIEQFFGGPPGSGATLFPHETPQMVDFASRGLTADGRVKPDIVATAAFLFSSTLADFSGDGVNDTPFFSFGSGTSFSSPTVAGAAALLASYANCRGRHGRAPTFAHALMKSAQPIADRDRVSQRKQGRGFVYLPGALELLRRGHVHWPGWSDPRDPMTQRVSLDGGHAEGECPPLAAGESYDFFLSVPEDLGNLHFSFPSVTTGSVQNPVLGDGLQVTVHTAKRGGAGDYRFFATPVAPGESFDLPMPEPGRVRVTMSGFPLNYGDVSGTFTVESSPFPVRADHRIPGRIRHDGWETHTVEVPAGLDALAVRLRWRHDWQHVPTYDLDLFIEMPDGFIPAASLDSPELAWIESPAPGLYTFAVNDFSTVRGSERYSLEIAEIRTRMQELPLEDRGRPRVVSVGPNPAASYADVKFSLPLTGRAEIDVYDVTGRLVRGVLNESLPAGAHQARWDGRTGQGTAAANGVYFVRLKTEAGTSTKKVLLRN
ncbi:MAG: hypothetical protein DHS20C21_22610 [Gemmatimonadota bacterium]|nr:MAG: hypothetical protein DHS20C21_22610 [Gemmatimonadota bacterium]